MNTIEIYLTSVGENQDYTQNFSFAELIKDFPIYQNNYQNIVLNINIPTSILPSGYEIAGVTTNTMGVAVKVDASSLARNGAIRQSKSFYLRYLKTWVKDNVEYAMFQRPFPQTFALYAGQGQNAPKLTINVVNIMNDTLEDPNPTVVSIITSQTCSLEIMPSTILDKDEPLDPSDLDEINARLSSIEEEQFVQNANISANAEDIDALDGRVSTNEDNIEELQEQVTALGGTPFTNEKLGLIKGSTDTGKISANEDGTGSVNGFDSVLNRISTNENDIANIESEQITQNTNIQNKVDKTTKINNKELTQDITLDANDVGALPNDTVFVSSVNGRSGAVTGLAEASDIPTKTSDLTNDSGFITNVVDNLTNYYLKNETYTQSQVNALIAAIKTVKLEIVSTLPTADATTYFNESKTIYAIRNTATTGSDYYEEYITVRTGSEGSYVYSWEKIGDTQIDLSNYVQKTFTIAGIDLQDNITKTELQTALTDSTHNFVTDAEKSTWNGKQNALTAGSHIDITNDVISSEGGVYRGTFGTWSDVPSTITGYEQDGHGNTTPLKNDYIVLNNGSGILNDASFLYLSDTSGARASISNTYNGVTQTVIYNNATGSANAKILNGVVSVYYDSNSGKWVITTLVDCVFNSVSYTAGSEIAQWGYSSYSEGYINYDDNTNGGIFIYDGVWATNGKNGWKAFASILSMASGLISKIREKQDALTQAQLNAVNSGMTSADKAKLNGIQAGAEVNVQADWNQNDSSADDYIKNKPNIPAGVVVDLTLDATSNNAISNSAVTNAVNNLQSTKQDVIDSTHKISADNVDDTSTTNKFVTTSEKSTWNAKQNALSTTQLDAVNSGIDSTKVTQIETNASNITNLTGRVGTAETNITNLQNSKQDNLTAGDNITIVNGVISADKDIEEITSAGVRITDLDSGIYKLIYSNPRIYYNGTSGTNYITLAAGQANVEAILVVNKIATIWTWYVTVTPMLILGSGQTYIYFGATDSSSGKYNQKTLNNIPNGIADNLTTNFTGYALDARQGYVLKGLIDNEVTARQSADNNKVDKTNQANKLYGTSSDGSQDIHTYSFNNATGWTFVQRDGNGDVFVPSTPSSDNGATSKQYVDKVSQYDILYQGSNRSGTFTISNITNYKYLILAFKYITTDNIASWDTSIVPAGYVASEIGANRAFGLHAGDNAGNNIRSVIIDFVSNTSIRIAYASNLSWCVLWGVGK